MSKVPFVVSRVGTAGEISGRVNVAGRVHCPGGTWTGDMPGRLAAFAVTPRVPVVNAAPCASHGRFLGTGHGGHRRACCFRGHRHDGVRGACSFLGHMRGGCVVPGAGIAAHSARMCGRCAVRAVYGHYTARVRYACGRRQGSELIHNWTLSSARIMGPGRCHDLGTTFWLLCHLGVCGGIRQAEWAGPVSLRVPAARARQPP